MKFLTREVWRKVGGIALATTAIAGLANASENPNVNVTSLTNVAVIESVIDEAMQDGSVSAEEKKLIMGMARRRMSAADVARLEARLAAINTGPVVSNNGNNTLTQDTPAPAASNCDSCCDEPGCGGLFDNMYWFLACDGWMGPIDDDDSNNFGLRLGFNMGLPVSVCHGVGAQFGMSYGAYNFHGRDAGQEASAIEDQIFLTLGIFRRADLCGTGGCLDRMSVGLVYDHMVTDNTGEEAWEIGRLGQFRWLVGYAISAVDEVGLMGSFRAWDDSVDGSSNQQDDIRALNQGSLYWKHKWCWSAETTGYLGLADDPGEFVFGARGEMPVSNCVSLFGVAQYILPSTQGGSEHENFAQEYWNVSVGLAYYPGGNAVNKSVAGRRWMPLLPVADNGTFAIDVNPNKL